MLREITPGDEGFAAFVNALAANGLPTEDLTSEEFCYFAWKDAAWGGVGVREDALLRSIVVRPESRGRGAGAAVTQAIAARAFANGTRRLWLLTTDAAPFFACQGWRTAEREAAPASIAASRQFSGLCPASATLMVRTLP